MFFWCDRYTTDGDKGGRSIALQISMVGGGRLSATVYHDELYLYLRISQIDAIRKGCQMGKSTDGRQKMKERFLEANNNEKPYRSLERVSLPLSGSQGQVECGIKSMVNRLGYDRGWDEE